MPFHALNFLKSKKIFLASNSPRRKEILGKILDFDICPSNFDESLAPLSAPQDYVQVLSKSKALAAQRLLEDFDLLISADTVVNLDQDIIGKPKSNSDAIKILKRLNARSHNVFTGVTIVFKTSEGVYDTKTFVTKTIVNMANVSDDVLAEYVITGEPLDKAGGYGTQGLGAVLIEGIEGDYYNVMGFPLQRFSQELSRIYEKHWSL